VIDEDAPIGAPGFRLRVETELLAACSGAVTPTEVQVIADRVRELLTRDRNMLEIVSAEVECASVAEEYRPFVEALALLLLRKGL
jgi:hypothetical protein